MGLEHRPLVKSRSELRGLSTAGEAGSLGAGHVCPSWVPSGFCPTEPIITLILKISVWQVQLTQKGPPGLSAPSGITEDPALRVQSVQSPKTPREGPCSKQEQVEMERIHGFESDRSGFYSQL